MSSGPLVIATDFSDVARNGLRWGCHLLERGWGPQVGEAESPRGLLLHVVLNAEAHALYPLFDLVDDSDGLRRQIAHHAEGALDRLLVAAAEYGQCGAIPLQAVVHHARSVADGILEVVDESAAGLVVLGTHGRSGFKRWLLGSVTEQVLRRVRCAVLCCPPTMPAARPPLSVQRILAAVDLSRVSSSVLDSGCQFAEALGASLEIAHVIPENLAPDEARPAYLETGEQHRSSVPELRERARDELVDLGSRRNLRRFAVRYRVAAGRPAPTLIDMATSSNAGLIVIASRTSSLEQYCLGSVTHALLRQATCPVLVVPPSTEAVAPSGGEPAHRRAIV